MLCYSDSYKNPSGRVISNFRNYSSILRMSSRCCVLNLAFLLILTTCFVKAVNLPPYALNSLKQTKAPYSADHRRRETVSVLLTCPLVLHYCFLIWDLRENMVCVQAVDFRKLLLSSDSDYVSYSETGTCAIDYSDAATLLSSSNNDFAQYKSNNFVSFSFVRFLVYWQCTLV